MQQRIGAVEGVPPPLPLARPPEFVVCPLMREIRAFRYFWPRKRLSLPLPALGDHSRRRLDIDGLRALAVGAVLVFHAFPYRLPGGHAGVDVFFVISGFVITGTHIATVENGTFSWVGFYRRR